MGVLVCKGEHWIIVITLSYFFSRSVASQWLPSLFLLAYRDYYKTNQQNKSYRYLDASESLVSSHVHSYV